MIGAFYNPKVQEDAKKAINGVKADPLLQTIV